MKTRNKIFSIGKIVLVMTAVLLIAFAFLPSTSAAPPSQQAVNVVPKLDSTPRVALASAFAGELALVKSKMTIENTYVISNKTFYAGKIGAKDYLAFFTSTSPTNASAYLEAAILEFNLSHIVATGISGGVSPKLNIGDVFVSSYWTEYQQTRYARQKPDGTYDTTSDLPNWGMAFPQKVSTNRVGNPPDKEDRIRWFPTDARMLEAMEKAAAAVKLNQCGKDRDGKDVCLSQQPKVVVGGFGVSGPTFVDNKDFREYTYNTFNQPGSLDMESSQWAHVAYANGIPLIVVRSLSDLAGGGPGANEISTFGVVAADNSATLLLKFLETWNPGSPSPMPLLGSDDVPVALPSTPIPQTKVNFGVVLVGPYNDHGWSEAHYTAANYVKSKVPGSDFIYIDKLNPADRPGTTLEQVVTDMASKGVKLIITTSDDFQTDTITAAQKHPELTFINVSGDSTWKDGKNYKAIPNLGNFMGKMEYMKMVAGCAAALTTQTGKIGFLGPLINDETRRLADAAFLGANYCWTTYAKKNAADLKFDVKWIGFWFNIPGVTLDPTKVANDFYNSGNDVVISGLDTTEALVVAGQRQKQGQKVWAVSYDYKNGCDEAPNACLGVPYFNWGPRYVKTVRDFAAGTLKASWNWDGPDWTNINNPDSGSVGFAFGKALSDANKATVQNFIDGMASGSINLLRGPIKLQDGSQYLKDGVMPTNQQIWYLPQLLAGMTGPSAPTK